MWFKNLRLYRLTEQWSHTNEELNTALEAFGFNPCGSLDRFRYGFVPPLGRHGSEYFHTTNGYVMICAKKQEKILPSSVINEQLEEKAKKYKSIADYKNSLKFSSLPNEQEAMKMDVSLKEKRERWHESLSKDIYVEEAINVLDDLQPKDIVKKAVENKLKKDKVVKS